MIKIFRKINIFNLFCFIYLFSLIYYPLINNNLFILYNYYKKN